MLSPREKRDKEQKIKEKLHAPPNLMKLISAKGTKKGIKWFNQAMQEHFIDKGDKLIMKREDTMKMLTMKRQGSKLIDALDRMKKRSTG